MTKWKEASDWKKIWSRVHEDEEEATAKIERWKSGIVLKHKMQKHGNFLDL